jgi:hypothetical protein
MQMKCNYHDTVLFAGQCLPGTFSVDGLEPCETCVVGFYQPGYADTRCLPCPNDTTTWRRGSRRITECGCRYSGAMLRIASYGILFSSDSFSSVEQDTVCFCSDL